MSNTDMHRLTQGLRIMQVTFVLNLSAIESRLFCLGHLSKKPPSFLSFPCANFETLELSMERSDAVLTPSSVLSVTGCRFEHQSGDFEQLRLSNLQPVDAVTIEDSRFIRAAMSIEFGASDTEQANGSFTVVVRNSSFVQFRTDSAVTITDGVTSGSHRGAAYFVNSSFEDSNGPSSLLSVNLTQDTAFTPYRLVLEENVLANNTLVDNLISLLSPAASMLLLRNEFESNSATSLTSCAGYLSVDSPFVRATANLFDANVVTDGVFAVTECELEISGSTLSAQNYLIAAAVSTIEVFDVHTNSESKLLLLRDPES